MQISREQFLAQQKQRQEWTENKDSNTPKVGFFSLKDDGDEAIVRFAYDDNSQYDIFATHQMQIDDKFRRINCIRDFHDSLDKCPLCESGQKLQQRFYIRLVEYSRDENGQIVATPKIWERPTSYVSTMDNLFTEYGNVSDVVFKIKRSGKKGSLDTKYSIMLANPNVYNANLYPKQPNAFDGYSVLGTALLNKSFEDMKALVSGERPVQQPTTYQQPVVNNTQPTPTNVQSTQPRRVTY